MRPSGLLEARVSTILPLSFIPDGDKMCDIACEQLKVMSATVTAWGSSEEE